MNKPHIFSSISLSCYSCNFFTSGTALGLCCADLQCPGLSSGSNKHYEISRYGHKTEPWQKIWWKKGKKAPLPGELPCQGSFLLVSSLCLPCAGWETCPLAAACASVASNERNCWVEQHWNGSIWLNCSTKHCVEKYILFRRMSWV